MSGKTPTQPTPEQERQFAAAVLAKYQAGELDPEHTASMWDGLERLHTTGITGGNTQEGKDLYQFMANSLYDTSLTEDMRRQLAEAHSLRVGYNVGDPTLPVTQPDYNGMGNDGGQRTPTNTGGDSGGPAWGGSGSHDIDGNIIPGGSADPNRYAYRPPTGSPGINFGGGGGSLPGGGQSGAGGGTGGPSGGLPPGGNLYGPPMPFGGYEGPNAELYASQFGNAVAGSNAFQHNQLAAALRKEQADSQPSQPFDFDSIWKDLPQVRVNQAQPGETSAYDWILNPAYNFTPGESSNADMLRAVMGNNSFTGSDRSWFEKAMQDGNMDSDYYWSQQRNPQDILQQFDYSGDNIKRMTDAVNLMFARQDLSTPAGGGPAAPPPGYAAPR